MVIETQDLQKNCSNTFQVYCGKIYVFSLEPFFNSIYLYFLLNLVQLSYKIKTEKRHHSEHGISFPLFPLANQSFRLMHQPWETWDHVELQQYAIWS